MTGNLLDAFIAEHGAIVVCGESDAGPSYTLADGTMVFAPLDQPGRFFILSPGGGPDMNTA